MVSVSVKDVAALAGVSLGTVSNVLNRPDRVAPGTRDRVLAAIDELGFVRNEAARQLRAGHSRMIGLVVLDVGNPFFTDVAIGVEQAAAGAGLSVILCNSAESTERENHYLSLLQEHRAYGVLITPVAEQNPRIEQIRRRGIPTVLVDHGTTRRQCSVSVDDVVGGELAAAHLLAAGHERIAFLGGPLGIKQVADRLAGARKAIRAAGVDPFRLTLIETGAMTVAAGRAAAERLRAVRGDRPTGVCCANDMLALGVLQDMTRHHVDVPGELAIVGYDDIDFAAAAAVPLTSVRQPRVQLGEAAATLLIDEVERPATHQHRQVVFEPELVVRESTTPAAGAR
ncbi:MAG TPA: LacI family DNA-binding transcriptional regulator [Pseudonocardiaceae bacterium]|nr:LacI family DNA-binding transcriptional regulator [Pseudonocardiaceae bacterium]